MVNMMLCCRFPQLRKFAYLNHSPNVFGAYVNDAQVLKYIVRHLLALHSILLEFLDNLLC